jgi:hypothetical protein
MADEISELKTLQGLMQALLSACKNMDQSLERLKSMEQLMERVAGSNEEMLKLMHQSMEIYNERAAVRPGQI